MFTAHDIEYPTMKEGNFSEQRGRFVLFPNLVCNIIAAL